MPTLAHIYCRLDSQAKGLRLAETTECKEGLESKLEQLNEAHSALTQQHEGLEADLTQVQGSLQAAEAARASAEVATPCFAAVGSQLLRQSQTWIQVRSVDAECCKGTSVSCAIMWYWYCTIRCVHAHS